MTLTPDAAERLAVSVLGWIAADEDRARAFLAASGAEAEDLRARADDPDFLGFVMDFVTAGDDNILAFAAEAGCRPEDLLAARAALPGGDLPHWT